MNNIIKNVNELIAMMKTLRDSDKGCPWVREQTFDSLKQYIQEEAFELIEAIDSKDKEAMLDELADALFHILFLAQIAEEKGQFNLADILQTLSEKMRRRNPHVFINPRKLNLAEIEKQWLEIKATEKKS